MFFDSNPLSQLSIVITTKGIAKVVSHFGNSPAKHVRGRVIQVENLYKVKDTEGEASLENGLKLALGCLELCPSYAHKEVLTIYGALNTCDPGNIFEVMEKYKKAGVPCSCISMSVMMNLNKEIAESTGGTQHTILNEPHFALLL